MSYSDDLDWLARNVNEWPSGEHQSWCYVGRDYLSGDMRAAGHTIRMVQPGLVRRDDWLARRAELQNKPSWDKAEDWTEWLAQDQDGEWKWLAGLPGKYVDGWTAVKIKACCKGLALGDWRDTLEKRPEIDMSAERVQETEKSMSEDIEDVLELAFWEFDAARSKSGEERICFKNKARWLLANYGARGEPEHDDDWHERGVLPPAGIRCEAEFGGVWELVYVVGRDSFDRLVIECADGDLIPVEATNFRPIRTERDQLVDVLCKAGIGSYALIAADAILAAGFKREGGAS